MKLNGSIIGTVLRLVLLFPATSYLAQAHAGNVILVPEDQPTIQACIEAAQAGDTCSVAPGTYTEGPVTVGDQTVNIHLNKAIILKSRELYQAILDGQNASESVILVRAAAHIEGFVIKNSASAGIHQRFSSNVKWTANNLIIHDVVYGILINDKFTRIGSADIANVWVDQCDRGFVTNDANRLDVKNSVVSNCNTGFEGYDHNAFTVDYSLLFNVGTDHRFVNSSDYLPIFGSNMLLGEDPQSFTASIREKDFPYFLKDCSPAVDAGDPTAQYNDASIPPSLGTSRNDIGAYGGPGAILDLSQVEKTNLLNQTGCRLVYLSLGDSYSSGEGAGDYMEGTHIHPGDGDGDGEDVVNLCVRSNGAYSTAAPGGQQDAAILPESERLFYACSGAIMTEVVEDCRREDRDDDDPEQPRPECEYTKPDNKPQIDRDRVSEADITTITIGGNDAGFGLILKRCFNDFGGSNERCFDDFVGDDPVPGIDPADNPTIAEWALGVRRCEINNDDVCITDDDCPAGEQCIQQAGGRIDELFLDLVGTYIQIKEATNDKPLLVLNYPSWFLEDQVRDRNAGRDGVACNYDGIGEFSIEEVGFLDQIAKSLNKVVMCAAKWAGAHFVDIDSRWNANRLNCDESRGGINGAEEPDNEEGALNHYHQWFHPNNAGHIEMANILRDAIRKLSNNSGQLPESNPPSEASDECLRFLPQFAALSSVSLNEGAIGNAFGATVGELHVSVVDPGSCNNGQSGVYGSLQPLSLKGFGFSSNTELVISARLKSSSLSTEMSLGTTFSDETGMIDTIIDMPVDLSEPGFATVRVSGVGKNGAVRALESEIFGVFPSKDADADTDGVPDMCDLCPSVASADQIDSDEDGLGDACDPFPHDFDNDFDGDGLSSDEDICPYDRENDLDDDGVCEIIDNCPYVLNPNQMDSDFDGIGDECVGLVFANAGYDKSVNEGVHVSLDGSKSSPKPLNFSWTQIFGAPVGLDLSIPRKPSFQAPAVDSDQILMFELIVDNGEVSSDPDTVDVEVRNINDPPTCSLAYPSIDSLWPPNHKMVDVTIEGITDSDVTYNDVRITITGVTQDEPVNGTEDGNTSPDAVIVDGDPIDSSVQLRAERAGNGNGRVYVIDFLASDGFENCTGAIQVGVPHNRKKAAIDDGQIYDATLP